MWTEATRRAADSSRPSVARTLTTLSAGTIFRASGVLLAKVRTKASRSSSDASSQVGERPAAAACGTHWMNGVILLIGRSASHGRAAGQ